jgi:hypothetical protein
MSNDEYMALALGKAQQVCVSLCRQCALQKSQQLANKGNSARRFPIAAPLSFEVLLGPIFPSLVARQAPGPGRLTFPEIDFGPFRRGPTLFEVPEFWEGGDGQAEGQEAERNPAIRGLNSWLEFN